MSEALVLRCFKKPTKRVFSERNLLNSVAKNRLNSFAGEIKRENYIKINNSALNPEEVASMIKERFKL